MMMTGLMWSSLMCRICQQTSGAGVELKRQRIWSKSHTANIIREGGVGQKRRIVIFIFAERSLIWFFFWRTWEGLIFFILTQHLYFILANHLNGYNNKMAFSTLFNTLYLCRFQCCRYRTDALHAEWIRWRKVTLQLYRKMFTCSWKYK